jgi:hypothetical protein
MALKYIKFNDKHENYLLLPNHHQTMGIFASQISLMLEDWLLSLMSTLVMGFGPQD